MRVEHIKQSSSKQSILRNSMHLHLGIDFGENNNDENKENEELLISRKYSNDSNHSNHSNKPHHHSYKNSAFTNCPLHEEKEQNDGYMAGYIYVDNDDGDDHNN